MSDFDGTLVHKDILDIACGIVGKEEESRRINEEFHQGKRLGLPTIITRINYLKGVKFNQIKKKLDQENYLNEGAKEMIGYLLKNRYISVLYSGNIIPILAYYQQLLGFNYIVGTRPRMKGDTILGISKNDFPKNYKDQDFKVYHIERFLQKININPKDVLAIGNSPSDIPVFKA